MRTILCYGDSNTFGADPFWITNPEGGGRFPDDVRWPGVLDRKLGDGYRVIEEGLPGRTTVRDDPVEGAHKNGMTYLLPCLESHRPLNLVVVMLGSNDLKGRFAASASDIAQGAGMLAGVVQMSGAGPDGGAPKVLLIAPPPVGKLTGFAEMFKGAEEKSRRFSEHYRWFTERLGCGFFDASEAIVSSDVDGLHLEADEHRKLGEAVAAVVKRMLDEQD